MRSIPPPPPNPIEARASERPSVSPRSDVSSRHPPRSSIAPAFSSSIPPREESFLGATGSGIRFRPARFSAAELPGNLICRVRCEGESVGPLTILDLGATGFAATIPPGSALPPGSVLEDVELLLGDRLLWSGDAVVVHGDIDRIGARFTSGVLDLDHLQLGATLESRLAVLREQKERLPASWRAAVSDVRQLLEDVRLEVEEFERTVPHDPLYRAEEEATVFESLRTRWGATYYASLAAL